MKTFQLLLKFFVFSMILFSFSCSSKSKIFEGNDNEWTTKDITQNRDLTQYEQGNHFYCNRSPKGENGIGEKKVCDFILQHLNEKRRGYIKISCDGVDTSHTSHIFVEPDEKGEWNILVRTVGQHAIKEYSNDEIGNSHYSSVECLENYSTNAKWTLIYITKEGQKIRSL